VKNFLLRKLGKVMIEIDPQKAFELAKKAKDEEMKELAKEKMKKFLEKMEYDIFKDAKKYSKKELEKIAIYLSYQDKYLVQSLKNSKIKKPE